MEDMGHYVKLARHLCFERWTVEGLEQVAKYRFGKKTVDIAHAVNRGIKDAITDAINIGAEDAKRDVNTVKLDYIARNLSEVVEIDTNQTVDEFAERLKSLPKPID